MTHIRFRGLKSSIFLVVILAWISQCYAIEFSEEDFLEKLNGVVKDGLLNKIAKSIPEDEGDPEFCAEDLLKWSEDLKSGEMWALTSKSTNL